MSHENSVFFNTTFSEFEFYAQLTQIFCSRWYSSTLRITENGSGKQQTDVAVSWLIYDEKLNLGMQK